MSTPVVIENPIINSPFVEPGKHFRFDDQNQILNETLPGRRPSSYFVPIATPRRQTRAQRTIDSELPDEQKTESYFVNRIRQKVAQWRSLGWPDVTSTTRTLLEHWTDTYRSRKLFFCQIEALETIIFITEVAKQTKFGDMWIESELKQYAQDAETPLFRMACKMATGTGKTVVMSMLIAWQTLNKKRYPHDPRFSDTFLVISPGITIKDRLNVLLPSNPNNYYRALDLVPPEYRDDLGTARIAITNFHAFMLKDKGEAGGLTKRVLEERNPGAFKETPAEMVKRLCRSLGTTREILVINDEAHHCYRKKEKETVEKLTAEERKEALEQNKNAHTWITGLEHVNKYVGIKTVYDLSATPFYLKGSGYPEGTLFPWVVSDFALIDAIESGIVKIPRVPVADNAVSGDFPKYRNLWYYIRDGLPKRKNEEDTTATLPVLPQELQGAMESLYGHYQAKFADWEKNEEARANGRMHPVFIVVCNNTMVSRLVFDYISGKETSSKHPDGSPIVAPGKLNLFSNVKNQRWNPQPNTILVDSRQFESEEGMTPEFKKLFAPQIDRFKSELRSRSPGTDTTKVTDEELMREVLNSVGKKGRLGENIRCVVSVSMLTEGWDANTVTHILGVRAFGSQLLCEQVVGRGLRRSIYAVNDKGFFQPEYADVYGVPFSFIPVAGAKEGRESPEPTPGSTVRAMPERLIANPHLEITFPRVLGYRYEVPPEALKATFDSTHIVKLSTVDIPTRVENAPIVGESAILTLNNLKGIRTQTIAFRLTTHLQQHHFADKPWLFPQLLLIVKDWLGDPERHSPYVDYGDETFPGLLLFVQKANEVAEKIKRAIIANSGGEQRLRAHLPETDFTGSTSLISYDTVKTIWTTNPLKCHLNFVPEDSGWETAVVEKLERMDEVKAYVKNQGLGFKIPYTHEGRPGNYFPDLIVKIDDGHGLADYLNLIIEISGQELSEKEAKVETAKNYWVPSVNNEGKFGRWAFLEIDNPDKAMQEVRKLLASKK